jgi:hypothetical protein
VRMPLIPTPHHEGYASYLAAMQLELTTAPWGEPQQLPALELLKSLDDLDEEEDEDEDDDDEDEDEEDDEDGGVKPLKMA